jgi:hypothetical protein
MESEKCNIDAESFYTQTAQTKKMENENELTGRVPKAAGNKLSLFLSISAIRSKSFWET